jgi:hypothetical protein
VKAGKGNQLRPGIMVHIDNGGDNIGAKLAPFPESPERQKELLDEVNRIVWAAPLGLGKVCLVGAGRHGTTESSQILRR